MGFRGLGFLSWGLRVRGYAFREFGVSGTGFLVICSGFRGRGARFGVSGTGCTVQGFGYRVSRLGVSGFGVSATGFRDSGFYRFGVSSTTFLVHGFAIRGFGFVVS